MRAAYRLCDTTEPEACVVRLLGLLQDAAVREDTPAELWLSNAVSFPIGTEKVLLQLRRSCDSTPVAEGLLAFTDRCAGERRGG